jgi:hypothetical protein
MIENPCPPSHRIIQEVLLHGPPILNESLILELNQEFNSLSEICFTFLTRTQDISQKKTGFVNFLGIFL